MRVPSVQRRGRARLAWSGGIAAAVLAALGFVQHRAQAREAADVQWVRDSAVPAIRTYVDSGLPDSAFLVSMRAHARSLSADSALSALWPRFTAPRTIRTVPESATVGWTLYADSVPTWWTVGTTPLDSLRVPRLSRLRLEKEGYRPLEVAVAAYRRDRTEPFVLTPGATRSTSTSSTAAAASRSADWRRTLDEVLALDPPT